MKKLTPKFTVLTPAQSRRVLQRNHVGRLAYRTARTVDIVPLGYVTQGRWIYLRSGDGTKLAALARDPYVAFQVDEVAGPFDWKSVVVKGTAYMLDQQGGPVQRREYEKALRLIRTIMPAALTPDDPVPERHHIYGLNIQHITGRAARQGKGNR